MGNKIVTKTADFANFCVFETRIFQTNFFLTIHGNNPIHFNIFKTCSQYFF
jgi:hypothetical protein